MHKYLLCPERLREVPEQFSWLDHRLVSDHRIDICSHQAAALYLFLVIVGDSKGLSYYSDASLMRRLGMAAPMLDTARRELVGTGLVCFEKPLYQVLSLDVRLQKRGLGRGGPMSLGEIMARIQEAQP
jgi:hypothetical protein